MPDTLELAEIEQKTEPTGTVGEDGRTEARVPDVSTKRSIVNRVGSTCGRVIDFMARSPRWVDAPWAVLSVVGYVLAWIFESGPPYWWGGISMLALMLRFNVTTRRLQLRTSSLTPVAERLFDWIDERRAKRRAFPTRPTKGR